MLKYIVKTVIPVFFYLIALSVNSQQFVKFAAIGDYGLWQSFGEARVSQMVHSWNPDFIITLGDNNYDFGADSTIDSNIGQYYHDYIRPYFGVFGNEAPFNKFFPCMGNHDWYSDSGHAYFNFFTLPGNERYYDYVKGNCHFFVLNSDPIEPDGITAQSIQANWLKTKLLQSTARFKIVYFHHPPYSSGQHGNTADLQWPFKDWGANVVLCGHEHNYERLVGEDGMTYFINGVGGKDYREFAAIVPESRYRFTGNFGAMLITSYRDSLNFKFYAYPDSLKDDTTLVLPPIGIEPISEIAEQYSLSQNYPNPFNPSTTINFSIMKSSFVNLNIYDASGRMVSEAVNSYLKPGTYSIKWHAENLASGIYFYSIKAGEFTEAKKMMIIK